MITEAESLLRQMLGPAAEFRAGQWEVVEAVVNRRRAMAVQSPEWDKGAVYCLATKLLRDRGEGPALLISSAPHPLNRSLSVADRIGLRVMALNSTSPEQWSAVKEALRLDVCDMLVVSPERLTSHNYLTFLLSDLPRGPGLVITDEVHCVSDWGHDFRPEYWRLLRIARAVPRTVPLLAFTSTANSRVIGDLRTQLGGDVEVVHGSLDMSALRLQTIRVQSDGEKLAWLSDNIHAVSGAGVVYCSTAAHVKRVARWLRSEGLSVEELCASQSGEQRLAVECKLVGGNLKAVVTTPSMGRSLGVQDLAFVVHYQSPGSVVSYYQQLGQASRASGSALGILLTSREDENVLEQTSRAAFPSSEAAQSVLRALERNDRMGIYGILHQVNLSRATVEQALKLMEIEGAVAHEGNVYYRTSNPWHPDVERAERIAGLRHLERQQMQQYAAHRGCLMEYLTNTLDDPASAPCGRCASCASDSLPQPVETSTQRRVAEFIKRDYQVIEPRRNWPVDATPNNHGRISPDFQNREGRALCIYGDSGWGDEVARGRHVTRRFSDALLYAAIRLIQHEWNPQPAPMWVTAVPSLRRPKLVQDFARRLARALGLPFYPVLVRVSDAPEQRLMFNSAQQSRNVRGSLAVNQPCLSGPVLVVDDVVDSRWTMSVAGWLLRREGSGPVYPFALATTAGEES